MQATWIMLVIFHLSGCEQKTHMVMLLSSAGTGALISAKGVISQNNFHLWHKMLRHTEAEINWPCQSPDLNPVQHVWGDDGSTHKMSRQSDFARRNDTTVPSQVVTNQVTLSKNRLSAILKYSIS